MNRGWIQYTLEVDRALEEELAERLAERGYTLGWVEPAIEVITTENGYDYAERTDVPLVAHVFEPWTEAWNDHLERFRQFLETWGEPPRMLAASEAGGEETAWQESFQPVRAGAWWIAPSWVPREELPVEGPVLRIDPGAAFGTGYHGTTRDILVLLQEMPLAGVRVLDIGAGSGILSVFCALKGAEAVWAVDINPSSAGEIARNLALNGLPPEAVRVIVGDPRDEEAARQLPAMADLILVNIGADEDVAMLPIVVRTLAPGGTAILSGIVEWKRAEVLDACRGAGLTLAGERQSEEWLTIALQL